MSPVDAFLDELGRRLRGPLDWRCEVVAEIRTHLLEAVEREGGDEAAVVEAFGDPLRLARNLNRSRQSRWMRLAVTVVTAVGVAALASLLFSGQHTRPVRDGQPRPIGRVSAATARVTEVRLLRADIRRVRLQARNHLP